MGKENLRIILIGESGAGKSATGNSILGSPKFDVSFGDQRRTYNCDFGDCKRFGINISIADTPGLRNAAMERNEESIEVENAIKLMQNRKGENPNVFLYCIRMGRISEHTTKIMKAYENILGHEMMQYTIIVFTCHDIWQLNCEQPGASDVLNDYESEITGYANKFIKQCRDRIYFNNNLSGEEQEKQVRELVRKINEMMWRNDDKNYPEPLVISPVSLLLLGVVGSLAVVGFIVLSQK